MNDSRDSDELYSPSIRHFLGHMIGKRIVDVTQEDRADRRESGESFIQIMLEDGSYVKFLNVEEFCDCLG